MRNQTIDIAKGIGILTVVICHNWVLYHDRGEFSRVVFSFHMPLFFFISGIFFKPNLTFKETLVSKANSILKPYIAVTLFLILFDYVSSLISEQPLNLLNVVIRGLYGSIGTLSVDQYSSVLGWVPLWFLTHLFALKGYQIFMYDHACCWLCS
jgi:polysaccharide biosynthesis protein PslL